MVESYKKHQPKRGADHDYDLQQAQDNIERVIGGLNLIDILNGRLITDVSVVNSATSNVAHKLGRAYKGWIIVNRTTAAATFIDAAVTTDKTKFLSLISNRSVANIISIWVF